MASRSLLVPLLLAGSFFGCGRPDLSGEGARKRIALLAVDPDGAPVRLWSATVHRVADGTELRGRHGLGSGSGLASRLEVPDEPLRLRVAARGYRSVEEIVDDPWERGAEWNVPLEPLPRVEGVIRHDGEPVGGAVVWFVDEDRPQRSASDLLEGRRRPYATIGSWWPPPTMGGARTGADGRYCLFFEREATVRVRAHATVGLGCSEPFELDRRNRLVTVDIDLDVPSSAVVGSVLLPEGREPLDICLEGNGLRWFGVGIAADGTFRAEGLPPGLTSLGIARRDYSPIYDDTVELLFSNQFPTHTTFRPPDWIEDAPLVLDLVPGEVHEVVLDLRARQPVRLEGRLRLDGSAPELSPDGGDPYFGWSPSRHATLEPWAHVGLRGRTDLCRAPLDDAGRFSLGVAENGTYLLRLHLWLNDARAWWDVLDRVSLTAEAPTSWSLDVPSGSLVLRGLDPELVEAIERRRVSWRWRGPGSRRIHVRGVTVDDDGTVRFGRVPAGPGELVSADEHGRVHLRTTVGAGGTTHVVFD